jgi:hypothetical protein
VRRIVGVLAEESLERHQSKARRNRRTPRLQSRQSERRLWAPTRPPPSNPRSRKPSGPKYFQTVLSLWS